MYYDYRMILYSHVYLCVNNILQQENVHGDAFVLSFFCNQPGACFDNMD